MSADDAILAMRWVGAFLAFCMFAPLFFIALMAHLGRRR
jgi:hypothetical protein